MAYTVLTFYKFLPLSNLDTLRPHLKARLQAHAAKGTILLSSEGVNGSIAMPPNFVESMKTILCSNDFFGDLVFKEHTSEIPPFRRLLIRIKKEIITFKMPDIDPVHKPAPYLPPKILKEWYESGKDMILLDTRNDFEIRFGAFENAQHFNLHNFTDFANIVNSMPEEMKKKTIVTYCTGGIRCEKAAPFLQQHGFEDVYQLEGGILNYFKECGGDHYEGECFVFDHRVALDHNLEVTETSYCTKCQAPIYDPEVKATFTVNERYCEDCQDQIPQYLRKRWQDFLQQKEKSSESA